tara:strand:- start:356 stop:1102 length:747 start_codon:yes stop_codon:yes gene_type:complete
MITLECPHNPKNLGDAIDCIFLGNAISKIEKTRVNVRIKHPDQGMLNEVIRFADVIVGKEKLGDVLTFHNNTTAGRMLYHKYSSQIKNIPRSTWYRNEKFTLPDKFVTAQWDAQQIYRDVRKYDKDKADKIEQKYIDEGYEIIRVGGEGEYKRLIDIMYLMQRADYHIGAESGMMHLAKFFMDCDRLHIYRNIQRREDQRFPDGWDVSWMGREMLRRGMRLNPKYEYNKEQEEYFKDTSLFYKQHGDN